MQVKLSENDLVRAVKKYVESDLGLKVDEAAERVVVFHGVKVYGFGVRYGATVEVVGE